MAKKPTKPQRMASRRIPAGQRSYSAWLSQSRTDVEIHDDVLGRIRALRFSQWPAEIEAMLAGLSKSVVSTYWPPQAARRDTLDRKAIAALVLSAVREGYAAAMIDHAGDILEADDAESLYDRREQGSKRGHRSQAQRSAELSHRIREKWAAMEAAGEKVTNDTVAAAMGCSRSTVIRAFRPQRRSR